MIVLPVTVADRLNIMVHHQPGLTLVVVFAAASIAGFLPSLTARHQGSRLEFGVLATVFMATSLAAIWQATDPLQELGSLLPLAAAWALAAGSLVLCGLGLSFASRGPMAVRGALAVVPLALLVVVFCVLRLVLEAQLPAPSG